MPTNLAGDKVLRAVAEAGEAYPTHHMGGAGREDAARRMDQAGAVVFDSCDCLALPRRSRLLAKIKPVAEQRRVPVVLVADPALLEVVASDPDWAGRFEISHLPAWRTDRDFVELLAVREDAPPLRENSHLAERELALHL